MFSTGWSSATWTIGLPQAPESPRELKQNVPTDGPILKHSIHLCQVQAFLLTPPVSGKNNMYNSLFGASLVDCRMKIKLNQYPGNLFIFGNGFVRDWKQLDQNKSLILQDFCFTDTTQ